MSYDVVNHFPKSKKSMNLWIPAFAGMTPLKGRTAVRRYSINPYWIIINYTLSIINY
jgi:hypothetical protein